MSNISDGIIPFAKDMSKRVCLASYTLNNSQPVRCTIIGDQPLFYMDDLGCGVEEDAGLFFDPADLGILENEIESLKKEIQSFDRLTEEYAQAPDKNYQLMLEDKAMIASKIPPAPAFADIKALEEILGKSRLAHAYLELAQTHNIKLAYSSQVDGAAYERRAGLILINPIFGVADQILLASRELRRHWQHRQGALVNPLFFHPDNAILVNRMQTADLIVSMIRIAWELQLCGAREAWERIENSSFSDLGRSFAREAFVDFRTINSGQAGASVLESWFLSERCRQEDKKLIKQMLADYQGYVFDREEGHKTLTPALISALGTMPYGKNYLAPHITTLMNDPVFNEVRDRSNANFLWFIKFERSFRETERDLQSPMAPSAPDNRSMGKTNSKTAHQDKNYDNAPFEPQSAEIIRIFPERIEAGDKKTKGGKILPPKSSVKRRKKKTTADIVYLRRWSGE